MFTTNLDLVTVYEWYKSAMSRRREGSELSLDSFVNHFTYSFEVDGIAFGNDSIGYILGYNKLVDNQLVFFPSHFAPKTIKGGYKLIKLLKEQSNVVFAVTEDLTDMLIKSGYYSLSKFKIPMFFRGELVIKHLFVNCGIVMEYVSLVIDNYLLNGVFDFEYKASVNEQNEFSEWELIGMDIESKWKL